MAGIEIEYWDTCIFLAFIKGEEHRPGELDYIKSHASQFDLGLCGIVTSAITITEVLEAKLTADQINRFYNLQRKSNFTFIDASPQVCKVASEIRSYYFANPMRSDGKIVYPSTPDAIHVASAIAAKSASKQGVRLITLDAKDKPKKGEIALTAMNGLVADKYPLTICRPPVKGQQVELTLTAR
ncbi:PIN domain-containing protein [Cupriavidus neocaledonicus]|uniref:PIN domain-containing protein n=1 Tax=Cupriavidus neocaledonicus TaxID=1040979 RepID=UPI0009DA2C9A|nr:PIN domain-containing protein [Cupriavidus neocaledonicus]